MGPGWCHQIEFPRVKQTISSAFLFSSVLSFSAAFLSHIPMSPGLATAALSCPKNVNISGGSFTLSNGWSPGSILTYSCPLGRYPYPVVTRLCKSNGQWQIPRSTRSTKAICKRESPCQRPPWGLLFSLLSVGLNVTQWGGKAPFPQGFSK